MTVLLMASMSVPFSTALAAQNTAPSVIPAIREWKGSTGKFTPDANTVLVNLSGSDSIQKVKNFFSEMLSLDLKIATKASGKNEITFKIDKSLSSKVGEEGYTINATSSVIEIKAPAEIGLLYGGVSVVQSCTADGFFPCGSAVDYPAYPVRSGMIDVGRAWIPMDYLNEITRYMAYFKMNEIHVHINDDGSNGHDGFRLESDIKGLSSPGEHYTKAEYRAYQKEMLEYGVTVITEIDTPFHSRCYARAENPPPYIPGNNRCLDISKPETLEFVKKLFAEYLSGDDPVFVNKIVHIGTDEYPREYAELMRWYTNELIEYVGSFGYTARFWAGLGEEGFKGTTPISEDAQINYWAHGISGFEECKASKYEVINTLNMILYTVPTTNYGFPDYFDLKTLYNKWQVNEFSLYESKTWDPNDKRLLGACFALWNDLHTTWKGVTRFDIFDRLRGMVCLTAEKTWTGLDTKKITYDNFKARYDKLSLRAGDSDPGRHALAGDEINIDFKSNYSDVIKGGKVENGKFVLDGSSYVTLENRMKDPSVGFPNTLEFEIRLNETTKAPLFAGDGVKILADADGSGKFGFTTEYYTFTYDYKIPVGETVKIRLSSDLTTTYLTVNDSFTYTPFNKLNPDNTVLTTLTIPLKEIGKGVKGTIDNIKVTTKAVDLSKMLANYNIALNAKTTVSGLEVNDGRLTNDMAVDGDLSTRLSFARDKDEQWLLVDLGSLQTVSRIEINFYEHVSEYDLYISEDNKTFKKVYEVRGAVDGVKQIDTITLEKPQKVRYVKYVQLKRWYVPAWNAYYSGGITEFSVYSFDETSYRDLIKEAYNFLKTGDKSDSRRNAVRSCVTDLENYINQENIFIINAEYYYNKLVKALDPNSSVDTPDDPPETSDPETSDPETSDPETSNPETSNPETSNPETSNPEVSDPATSSPDSSDVVSDDTNSNDTSNVTSDVNSENATDNSSDGNVKSDEGSSVWPIVGAIAAGVAIAAAVAFIIIKKRKK